MSEVKTKYDLLLQWLRDHKGYQRIIDVDRINSQFEQYLMQQGITDLQHRRVGRPYKYPFHKLEVKQFVVVTDTDPNSISASIIAYNKKFGYNKKFTIRQLTPSDCVLWRIK